LVTPGDQIANLQDSLPKRQRTKVFLYDENQFFASASLGNAEICASLNLAGATYTPGCFYQQLLKLGADEGIPECSDWFVVWDSDLWPVDTWPLLQFDRGKVQHPFALLQHRDFGNREIVARWEQWISAILRVPPGHDATATFVPHHMWFTRALLSSFRARIQETNT
jgi:hypothetical protein